MIMRNGKTNIGWRMDEVTEKGPVGMDMLSNPFAIVPDKENAERIELAFELLTDLKKIVEKGGTLPLESWLGSKKVQIDKVVGTP